MLRPLPDNSCNLCGRRRIADSAQPDGPSCTGRCLRGGLGPQDYALEGALLLRLDQLPHGAELSLAEACEAIADDDAASRRRALLAARRLVARGQIEMLSDGEPSERLPERARTVRVRLSRETGHTTMAE